MERCVWHEFGLKISDVNIESPIKHIDAITDGMICAIRGFMLVSVECATSNNNLLIS